MKRLLEILSPQRRYHEKKPLASLALRLFDLVLLMLPRRQLGLQRGVEPRRILLMNPAYIGDLLLSTSVLPVLRKRFPAAEIGFVVGSWSKQVLQGHPDVSHLHVVDIFRLNRGKLSLLQKLQQQLATQRVAEREIRELDYDLAIDLFTGFPPLSWLAWKCGIPRRVGYLNRGFGALLTEAVQQHVLPGKHEAQYHVDLVVAAGAEPLTGRVHPCLDKPGEGLLKDVAALLGWASLDERPYIVMHPGTGEALKEWPLAQWRDLTQRLLSGGSQLIFTGHGTRDSAQISAILDGMPAGAINLCGQLSWPKLCALVSRASALVGVDSMSGHLASAWQVPTITLHTGMSDPQRWRPANDNGIALHLTPPCLPCLNRVGCATMQCLRGVGAEPVEKAILRALSARQTESRHCPMPR